MRRDVRSPGAVIGVALVLTTALTAPLAAQTVPKKSPEEINASHEAHKAEFEYLLGDWEFTSVHKEYGKGHGVWSAVQLVEGQLLDEYRILGDKGETIYVTTTIRAFNAALDRWELVGMDAGNGLQDAGTARKVGSEMHIEQRFGVMSQNPSLWRIRYYDIKPDRFSWAADRSPDDGKTWEKNYLQIEARRIGKARSLGQLTVTKK
jgi:hypothetical protein